MINKKKHKNNPIEDGQGYEEAILRRNEIANKHMKRCSTLQVTKEMQIKARYHFSLIKLAKVKMTNNIHCRMNWGK